MQNLDKSKRDQLERMIAQIPDYRSRILGRLLAVLTALILIFVLGSFAIQDLSKTDKSYQCNILPLSPNAEKNKVISERQLFAYGKKIIQYPGRVLNVWISGSPLNKLTKLNPSNCNGYPDQILSMFFWWVLIILIYTYPRIVISFVRSTVLKKDVTNFPKIYILKPAYIALGMVAVAYGSLSALIVLFVVFLCSRKFFRTSFNTHLLSDSKSLKRIDISRFSRLDRHVWATGSSYDKPLANLVQLLVKPATNDIEKSYVIYKWVTSNIAYDANAYFSQNLDGAANPISVFQKRKGVCAGYSYLLREMLQLAGVKAEVIDGYAKGFYERFDRSEGARPNHSWVGIRINGEWFLADPTWDAGGIDTKTGRFAFHRGHKFSYFLTSPYAFVKNHLPIIEEWQLLEKPISKTAFFKG